MIRLPNSVVTMLLLAISGSSFQGIHAFVLTSGFHLPRPLAAIGSWTAISQHGRTLSSSAASDFDFPSAMPEKPQLSLQDKMGQSADDFVANMVAVLGETKPPPELEALKAARENNAGAEEIAMRVYELMIERGMLYDEDPDTGALTPTDFDVPNNLDVPEVRQEFDHLYKYGMMLMEKGLISVDEVKTTVVERLVKRTGLTPEEFDAWLGY